MRALPVVLVTAAALSSACATTAPAAPPTAATARAPDDDVSVLKERVARLERRLADVDAKLGLLIAQRTPARSPASITHGAPDLGPKELIADAPKPYAPSEEASLGARSLDIGGHRSVYEDPPEPTVKSDSDDNGPPIVIKVVGDGPRDRVERSSVERPEHTAKTDVDAMEAPIGLSTTDQYAWAQARVKEGKYLEALNVFEEIAERHPHDKLADNSVYWIGWCHQARGDHKLAVDVWTKLPIRFPKSPKVPDALFGMASSEEALGEPAVAETLYEQLVSQYPRAEKVRDAKKALARLRPR